MQVEDDHPDDKGESGSEGYLYNAALAEIFDVAIIFIIGDIVVVIVVDYSPWH